MTTSDGLSNNELITALHRAHAQVTGHQRHLLEVIARCDAQELWRQDGARDTAEWLAAHLGISRWAARRWIAAAHALPQLPRIKDAFECGRLPLDKVLELCRFATPETEAKLLSWATRVTAAAIRRRADKATVSDLEDVREADKSRYLRHWSFDEGRRMGIEGSFAADQGALVVKALDRLAGRLPQILSEEDGELDPELTDPEGCLEARRADALVALASASIADDSDADRATMVIHAELSALVSQNANGELERGPVIHPLTALRLACDCRLQTVLEDPHGHAVGIGRTSRVVPRWLARQLLYRDGGCLFPGCGAKAFLHAHHIVHWIRGGATDLDNLCLLCSYHHKLVHEYGWRMILDEPGTARWYRPSGRPYDPGSRPGERAPPEQLVVA
jgi:hypothetical protein